MTSFETLMLETDNLKNIDYDDLYAIFKSILVYKSLNGLALIPDSEIDIIRPFSSELFTLISDDELIHINMELMRSTIKTFSESYDIYNDKVTKPDKYDAILQYNRNAAILCSLEFRTFKLIQTLSLNNVDTSSITSMSNMFKDMIMLEHLDISNWNTSNVTCMRGMFINCSSLQHIDVANWDTSNVISMYCMF